MPSGTSLTAEPAIKIDVASASMIVTLADQSVETYRIDKVPALGSTLVAAAKQEILTDLDLSQMIADLSRVSELLYLAYCGVVTTHVEPRISDRRKTFLDLCADCVTAMTDFEATGRRIANNVAEAFHWIIKGEEKRGLTVLARSGAEAAAMAVTAQGLADRSKALGDDVQKDQHDTLELTALEQDELTKIRAEREKMQADMAKQTSMNTELAASISTLQGLYEDAKSREEEAEKRAFISGIISSVTTGLGSAFGAYTAAKNPLGTAAANLSRRPDDEGSSGNKGSNDAGSGDGSDDQPETKPDDGADKKSDDGADAKSDDGDKAASSDGGSDADSTDKPKSGDKEKSKSDDHTAAGAGTAAGLDSVGKSTQKMSDDAAKAGESVRQEKMRLLDQKLAQEAKKREVVAQLAELSSKLTSSDTEQKIHESAQVALQIAVWAFANITTTLVITKQFWDNVKKACDRLANSDIQNKINDELQSGDDPKARQEYYLSDMFMPSAIGYLARWTALMELGREYKEGSIKARDSMIDNIGAAPLKEQARALLEPLKAKIAGELANDKAASSARSEKVKAELALLGSTN